MTQPTFAYFRCYIWFFEWGCPSSTPNKKSLPLFWNVIPVVPLCTVIKLSIDISQPYFTSRERFHFNWGTYNLPNFSSINGLFRENIKKIFLPENKMPQSFNILYVRSPSGTLPSLLKLWLCGQNGLIQKVKEFTLTYKLKRTKSPGLKPLGLDPWYHPVDGLYLNLLQIELWWQKWPHQGFTRAWSVFNRYI